MLLDSVYVVISAVILALFMFAYLTALPAQMFDNDAVGASRLGTALLRGTLQAKILYWLIPVFGLFVLHWLAGIFLAIAAVIGWRIDKIYGHQL